MNISAFIRDALRIFYFLYFQPAKINTHVLETKGPLAAEAFRQPLFKLLEFTQPRVPQYMLQMALLCALAAMPIFLFVPVHPPSVGTFILTFFVIWLSGLGVSIWHAPLGPAISLALALALGNAIDHAVWLRILAPSWLFKNFSGLSASLLIGPVIGVLTGSTARQVAQKLSRPWNNIFALGIGVVAGIIASAVSFAASQEDQSIVMYLMAFLIASFIAFLITKFVSEGMAFGAAFGIAFAIAFIVAFGVTDDKLASGLVLGIIAGLVSGGIAGFVAISIVVVIGMGVRQLLIGMAFGPVIGFLTIIMAVSLIDIMSMLPARLPLSVWWTAVILGVGLGARRWSGSDVVQSAVLLLGLAFLFFPNQFDHAKWWLLGGVVGFVRLPLLLIYFIWSTTCYVISKWGNVSALAMLSYAPWRWDDLISIPLPYLAQLLIFAGDEDRAVGAAYIEETATSWRQGSAARQALIRLVARDLANRQTIQRISEASKALDWVPQTLSPNLDQTLGRFREISRSVDGKIALTQDKDKAKLNQLAAIVEELDQLSKELTLMPAELNRLFLPIAQNWRHIVEREMGQLPNPYIAGNPIRRKSATMFFGRDDVLHKLTAQLRNRAQRPPLLLFGQRRMGKSSLLYQLPEKLADDTIPIQIDCQDGSMTESNQSFLFNLAHEIHAQALEHRSVVLPPHPELEKTSFTTFKLWLKQVENRLHRRILLLCIDEFEVIGEAIAKGKLDSDILGFLRHLIQHRAQITVLLAGSHHPNELPRPWSNYLINLKLLKISYLARDEAMQLIQQPIPNSLLHYQPEAVKEIIRLTHCQPLLIQSLCQEIILLLNERGKRKVGIQEVNDAVPHALELASALYFTYLKEYDAGSKGSPMLYRLAKRGPGAIMDKEELIAGQYERKVALERLLRREILEEVSGGVRFQIELVRLWWELFAQP